MSHHVLVLVLVLVHDRCVSVVLMCPSSLYMFPYCVNRVVVNAAALNIIHHSSPTSVVSYFLLECVHLMNVLLCTGI